MWPESVKMLARKNQAEGIGFDLQELLAVSDQKPVALSYPDAWVLKIVQAAVGWKADSLQVRQTASSTTFSFRPENISSFPSEHQILETVREGQLDGSKPIERLAMVLWGLAETAVYSFVLTFHDGENEVRPIYYGSEILVIAENDRPTDLTPQSRGLRLTVSHLKQGEKYKGRYFPRSLLRVRRDLEIALELEKNAFVCPLPLYLDGRLLNHLFQHPKFGFSRELRPLLLAGVEADKLDEVLPLSVDGEQKVLSYFTDPRRADRFYHGKRDFTSWYMCRGVEPDQSRSGEFELAARVHEVLWVCDGVLVYREGIHLPTSLTLLTIFLNAKGLPTDQTGMQLEESLEREQRVRQTLTSVAREMSECAIHVDAFFETDRDTHSEADDEIRKVRRLQASGESQALTGLPALFVKAASRFLDALSGLANIMAIYRYDYLTPDQFSEELKEKLKWRLEGDFDRLSQIPSQPRVPIYKPGFSKEPSSPAD